MKRPWLGVPLAALALLCGLPAVARVQTVSVTGGQVQGVSADGITAFKGIPFAAPPVGNLRWREPQPVVPWSGVKQADRFAPGCMQDPGVGKQSGAQANLPDSEDCLYLNVWTAARSTGDKLPVMVWFYGGGLTVGMTSYPAFDGAHLSRKGVVLVSVAYRLGALGFLADPGLSAESPHHVSGNYGLFDVIAALHWVRANIAWFGGDPSRVTVFGQSAGGSIVGALAASPLAKGLFQRAISESGTIGGGGAGDSSDLPAAEATGKRFLARLGARDIAAARRLPAQVLLKAQSRIGRFLPVRDGYLRPDEEYERYAAGRFTGTPLLLGTNADEGRSLLPFMLPGVVTPARLEALVRAQYGPDADAILALYPHATDAEAGQAAADVLRDSDLGWDAWAWALLYTQHGGRPVYLYYFDRRSPQAPHGPTHGDETSYVFGNWVSSVNDTPFPPGGAQPSDLELSDRIQGYWVNFAKSGNPNGPGLPHWPVFTASSQQALYLDEKPHAGPVPNLKQVMTFEAHYARARRKAAPRAASAP